MVNAAHITTAKHALEHIVAGVQAPQLTAQKISLHDNTLDNTGAGEITGNGAPAGGTALAGAGGGPPDEWNTAVNGVVSNRLALPAIAATGGDIGPIHHLGVQADDGGGARFIVGFALQKAGAPATLTILNGNSHTFFPANIRFGISGELGLAWITKFLEHYMHNVAWDPTADSDDFKATRYIALLKTLPAFGTNFALNELTAARNPGYARVEIGLGTSVNWNAVTSNEISNKKAITFAATADWQDDYRAFAVVDHITQSNQDDVVAYGELSAGISFLNGNSHTFPDGSLKSSLAGAA